MSGPQEVGTLSQRLIGFRAAKLRVSQVLAVPCVLVFACILSAGLWPFHAPKNQAVWSKDGLRLGRHGTAFSLADFTAPGPGQQGRSIEVWLQPAESEYSGTILAFYRPGERQQFSLHQSKAFLGLQTGPGAAESLNDPARIAYVFANFGQLARRLVTITVGRQGTYAYVDGALVRELPDFRPTNAAFTGRLVIGTSPVTYDGWFGMLYGLALYDKELNAAEVRRDYESWNTRGRPDSDRAVDTYLFDERAGNVIHDRAAGNSGLDLFIPERFAILQKKLLEPVWDEFEWTKSYRKSVLINVAGFVPLGYFFCAFFSLRRVQAPFLTTVILGASVSLTIEVLQAFLPTRSSGTTDLITNTLGSCLGAVFYLWRPPLIIRTLRLILPRD